MRENSALAAGLVQARSDLETMTSKYQSRQLQTEGATAEVAAQVARTQELSARVAVENQTSQTLVRALQKRQRQLDLVWCKFAVNKFFLTVLDKQSTTDLRYAERTLEQTQAILESKKVAQEDNLKVRFWLCVCCFFFIFFLY